MASTPTAINLPLAELVIKPHSTIIVCAPRGVGKSFLSKFIIKNLVDRGVYDTIYLFSSTEIYSHSFNCLPSSHIVPGYDVKFINKILDGQKKEILKHGKESPKVASVLLVFDDLLSVIQPGSLEQIQLNMMFASCRHLCVGLLVISQTSRSLFSPTVRGNADYIFWRKINQNFLPNIYESVYWSENYKHFSKFVDKSFLNTDYEFICYNSGEVDDSKKFMLVKAEKCDFMIEYGNPKKKKDSKKKPSQKIK
jgi:hypothetical protein